MQSSGRALELEELESGPESVLLVSFPCLPGQFSPQLFQTSASTGLVSLEVTATKVNLPSLGPFRGRSMEHRCVQVQTRYTSTWRINRNVVREFMDSAVAISECIFSLSG